MLNNNHKQILKDVAKRSLEMYIKNGDFLDFKTDDLVLVSKQGAFVTLKRDGELRGCIGLIISDLPLWQTVRDMAIAAGTQDNRFSPISEKELDNLNYEISVLTPFNKVNNWQDIEIGRQGVLVKKGQNSGLFLPQVATENNWNLEEFLSNLCRFKAGLEAEAYKNDPEIELYTFEAEVF